MTGNRAGITPGPVSAAIPSAALEHPAKPGALGYSPRPGIGDVAGRRSRHDRAVRQDYSSRATAGRASGRPGLGT